MSKNFTKSLTNLLPIQSFQVFDQEVIIFVNKKDLFACLAFLKYHTHTQYTMLTCISGVDYPESAERFEVVYDLLSLNFNTRIRVKTRTDEVEPLTSVVSLFSRSGQGQF
ncbi:unnamed protein product [Discosporangium mesarthrocarpum]